MPAGEKKTACVTGGNGYLASILIKHLLERSYHVHATIRDPEATEKVAHLKALEESYGELKVFQADLSVDGSFDQAVTGCDYVFHVANPMNLGADDPEKELIKPAVEGTLNVLRSCARAQSVKRVICTSSGAAVSGVRLEGTDLVLDEKSWTDVDFLASEKPPTWGYLAAKTLAEKAAWKFAKENGIDLVTTMPALIVGPGLGQEIPFSIRLALAVFTGDMLPLIGMQLMQKLCGSISIVHVDDACRAHIFLAETTSASGRYIVSQFNTSLPELTAFLTNRYPQYKCTTEFGELPEKPKWILSSEKLIKAGYEFKVDKLEDIYDEAIEYGKAVGLLPEAM